MTTLDLLYQGACEEAVDICEHLPLLRDYAEKCETIVEFGVFRGSSTTALLAGCPGEVFSYDIRRQPEVDLIAQTAAGRWVFREGSSLLAAIPACDLLFIDSWHTGPQLELELELHSGRVRRWIIMHDTETFGVRGENGGKGLWGALVGWLERHPEWTMKEHYTHNNGLTVLERK